MTEKTFHKPNIGRGCMEALRFEGERVSSRTLLDLIIDHIRSCNHEDLGLTIDFLVRAHDAALEFECEEDEGNFDYDKFFVQGDAAWQLARDRYVSGVLSGYKDENGKHIKALSQERAQGVQEDFYWPDCITWNKDRYYSRRFVREMAFAIGYYDGVLKTELRKAAKQWDAEAAAG